MSKRFLSLGTMAMILIAGVVLGGVSFHKVARVPIGQALAIDGYGDVVYAGVGGAVDIYNIYRRDYPQLMGTIDGHFSIVKAISVQDDRLYVLYEHDGLFIFDISNPYTPTLLGSIPSGGIRLSDMDISDTLVYVSGEKLVAALNVANPAEISVINSISLPETPMKIDYKNGRLYLAMGRGGLAVLGVAKPKSFVLFGLQPGFYTMVKAYGHNILYGKLDNPKPGEPTIFPHLFSFPFISPVTAAIRDNTIFAGGLNNFAIYTFDQTTNSHPKLVWNLGEMPTMDCVLKGNNIYLANREKGLSVYDISDIHSPSEIGRVNTFDTPNNGCLVGNIFYIAAGRAGVLRIDISSPAHPIILDNLASGDLHSVWDVAEYQGDIYVLGARNDVPYNVFIEKVNPTEESVEAEYPVANILKPNPISSLAFGAGYCAVALGYDGIELMRIDGDSLIMAYRISQGSSEFYDIEFGGEFLYASDYHGGYHIYHIEQGTMPQTVSYIKTSDDGGNGIALAGNYLLAADATEGLTVIDISNPKYPTKLANYPSVWGTDVAVDGDLAYLADGQGQMRVYDISTLPDITLLDTLSRNGYWTHIYARDDYIYGLDIYNGIYIYRVLDELGLAKTVSDSRFLTTALTGNYPNPFNTETEISFSIAGKGYTDVSIYNILGRRVTTLIRDELPAGRYSLKWDSSDQPTGVYLVVLKTPDSTIKRKIELIK